MRTLAALTLVALSACTYGPREKGWTGSPGAQSYETAVASCSQSSYNNTDQFTVCMAGRGWTRTPR
ncbi:MAG: hypothetical protein IPK75_03335 [Acidobacteria bacterium]|jgi:hypothetical protein|nr:hypothetical protein [Acidobacteriota bacterium]